MKAARPEPTLISFKLPASIAERVADLPLGDQEALASLLEAIGEGGLDRLIAALAPGGRPSDYHKRLPLLRQMAREMMDQNPLRGFVGVNWRKGSHAAAEKVARSWAGQAVGHSASANQKWLVREWDKHGRRLLQECRDAMDIEATRAFEKYRKDMGGFGAIAGKFHGPPLGQVLSKAKRTP